MKMAAETAKCLLTNKIIKIGDTELLFLQPM